MNRIQDISKVLLIVAGLFVLAGNAFVSHTSPVDQEKLSENANQQEENETYIQSFDVVSQNLQLEINSPFLLISEITEIKEFGVILVNSSFKLASTKFFEILFEQIISPNAP